MMNMLLPPRCHRARPSLHEAAPYRRRTTTTTPKPKSTTTSTSTSSPPTITRSLYYICGILFVILSLTTAAAAAAPTTTTEDLRSIERETLLQGATADSVVVAILPDRSTSYANGVHNGLTVSAAKLNISLTIHDVGNYDQETSYKVLRQAIDTPTEQQPKIYIVWPIDLQSKRLIQILYQTHQVPILQINQIPISSDDDTGEEEWEWDHLLGYSGQSDELRASNAGSMMVDAMKERQIEQPIVVALGYPITYGGFSIAATAFRKAISNSTIQLVEVLPLEWGSQNAYDQMVLILDALVEQGIPLHGVYAMEDSILLGAFQAIEDRKNFQKEDSNDDVTTSWIGDITLVGTVCNGARSLLEDGSQYGTTVQSPYLEALLAMDSVNEFLTTGTLQEKIRFTPNPIVTGDTMNSLLIPFLDELYVGDELCTWNLDYIPNDGLVDSTLPKDICDWAECLFVPDMLLYAGYVMVGMNYTLALLCAIVIVMFRTKRIMTLAQPPFLLLVIVGACIDTTSILFMSQDNQHHSSYATMTQEELDVSCVAWPWLLTLGQMMTTATLVAKIYRVKVVTNGGTSSSSKQNSIRFRRVTVSARDVSGFILGGLLIDIIILIVWFTTDPFYWQIQVVQTDTRGHILSARGTCSSDGDYYWMYPSAILLLHFGVLIYANVLAYQTRLYHAISDSNMVAISLFNSIQLLLVATLMFSLSGDNVSIAYLVRSSYAFLSNLGVLSLVVVPKVYQCLFESKGDGLTTGGGSTHISGLHPTPHHPSARFGDGGNGGASNDDSFYDGGSSNGSSSAFGFKSTAVVSFGNSNGLESSSPTGSITKSNNNNNKTKVVRRRSSDLDFIVEEDGEHHSNYPMTMMSSLDDTTSPTSSSFELRVEGGEGEEGPHSNLNSNSIPTPTTIDDLINAMVQKDQNEEEVEEDKEDEMAHYAKNDSAVSGSVNDDCDSTSDHLSFTHSTDLFYPRKSSLQTNVAVAHDTNHHKSKNDKARKNEIENQGMDDLPLPQQDKCLSVALQTPSLSSSPTMTACQWMGGYQDNSTMKIYPAATRPSDGDPTDRGVSCTDGSTVLVASDNSSSNNNSNNKTFQRSSLGALLAEAEVVVSSPLEY